LGVKKLFDYIYDGTFEGLLTCIYEAFKTKRLPNSIVRSKSIQQSFIHEEIQVKTDLEKAEKVYIAIRDKISTESLRKVYYVFLSDIEESGIWIYQYVKLGWKIGSKIDNHFSEDIVLKIHKTGMKVLGEKHRILGLLRFQEIFEDVFYASIEPDHNILRLITPHFTGRFADQNWIIHDIKRKLTAVYDKEVCVISKTDFEGSFSKSIDEANYQKMWKTYFENIAIKSRVNPKLQRSFMPARYWKHLVEKQPD
jgi:probable DNA metabolism protein